MRIPESPGPQLGHWEAAKRVLRYVKGMAGKGLGSAINHATQEGLYLRMLQKERRIDPIEGGTPLLVDNQSSIKLAKNPVFHKRSKHIVIRFHFIREKIKKGGVDLEFVGTLAEAADQPTKHVG